ncbi:germination protein [Paenibacillus baekrokdamisoli]|uniref:Germination protein n=1 Tax=Paenibacillus baekrokdamisoli TaxID=1712516 RepID=A0A3G9IYG6_9BACL|nr:endospore germination permease [Paenibacillus baekrokdamisoli]MBB3068735.1 spore germination protein (amino acid permease) [Paenibacillus baekrokdamisoli]BBH23566.1 germination protein [Paenibacillus baekrokdamisoli]
MKKYALNEITLMQFIFLIHGAQVGIGIFSLPMDVAVKAGTDGWMSLILGWGCNMVASIVIVQVFKKYPNDTLSDLLIRLFGKFIGKLFIIPVIFYYAFAVWTILTITVLFVKHWFLPLTPDYIVMILLIVPGYFISRNGLRVLGRYSELVFYMMLWMPFILLVPLKDSHWIHLLPLFKEGWKPIFDGLGATINSFLGFEIVFFIYPFLKKKQLAMRGIVIANTLTLFVYLGATLICFAYFSPDDITNYNQPLLSFLKVIEFRFLERFDLIFLVLYLFIVSTTWLPYTFGVIFFTGQLLGKKDPAPFAVVFFLLIITLVFALHPSWNQAQQWQQFVSGVGIWFAYVFPFLLYLYVLVYNRFRRSVSS